MEGRKKNNVKCMAALLVQFFLVPVGTSVNSADFSKPPVPYTPDQIVKIYCRADLDGATLSTAAYQQAGLERLIAPGEFLSPGWDKAVLIKSFRVDSIKLGQDAGKIAVIFEVQGEIDSCELDIHEKTERYVFKLKRLSGVWKLIEPYDLPPHISTNAAIEHFESLMESQGETCKEREIVKRLKKL